MRGQRDNRALALRFNNNKVQWQQLPQPQIWPRRQKIPQQQVLTGPALIKRVERTNVVIVCPQQRVGFTQCNPYAMNVDRRENRNCYNCGGFGYLSSNCRNRRTENRIGNGKKLEYRQRLMIKGNNGQENLNRKRNLVVSD